MVLGVRFEPHGTMHFLLPGQYQAQLGTQVLYPTESGPALAQVVWIGETKSTAELPVCVGLAAGSDLLRESGDRQRRAEIEVVARELIVRHELPMTVLAVDYHPNEQGQQMAVIYYRAPVRVDFRDLLVDLGRALQCRLDLRQVADRDAARLAGDLGPCGRPLCCTTFLRTLEPVPREAGRCSTLVEQGACGRAMCCLMFGDQGLPCAAGS